MTRHRSREEREQEILLAAAEEVEARGYPALTMDGVAARTHLSKGGVYRYFANKEALALALFEAAFHARAAFDVAEVLAWELPIHETLLRLLHREAGPETSPETARLYLAWLQLLPECLYRPSFQEAQRRLRDVYIARYRELVVSLVARSEERFRPEFERQLSTSLRLASALVEGLSFQRISGLTPGEQRALLRRFIEVMIRDAVEVPSDQLL